MMPSGAGPGPTRPGDEPLTVLVAFGSVRAEQAWLGLARHLTHAVEARVHRALLADPVELRLPLLDRMYKEHAPGMAPELMERMAAMIWAADVVAVVSAEYNHASPAALKNLLDHFPEEWFHLSRGICTYPVRRFGGVWAAMRLRMTLAERGMPTMPTLLPVPNVAGAVTPEDWARDACLERATARSRASSSGGPVPHGRRRRARDARRERSLAAGPHAAALQRSDVSS